MELKERSSEFDDFKRELLVQKDQEGRDLVEKLE